MKLRFLFAIFIWAFLISPALAVSAADPFTIKGIHVDVTGASGDEARKQGVADAQARAFKELLRRLTFDRDQDRINQLLANEGNMDLTSYVRGLKFDREKTSPVRYVADIDVSFQQEAVKQLLDSYKINFSLLQSRPVVVVPIYWDGQKYSLWDETNPWLAAWKSSQNRSGLVPIIVPKGDVQDQSFTLDDATERNENAIADLARRYQTTEAIIVVGYLKDEDGKKTFLVSHARFGAAGASKAMTDTVPVKNPDDLSGVFADGVKRVYDKIQEDWKQESVARSSFQESVEARVTYASIKDWNDIKARLGKVAGIDQFDVSQFTREGAYVYIRHNGTLKQLQVALAQQDLILQTVDNQVYLRRLTKGQE